MKICCYIYKILNSNLILKLLTKQRSARGTLASKAKDALFSFFGEVELPKIKSSATPSEISRWKELKEVTNCYKKLFQKLDLFNNELVLEKIIENVFSDSETENSVPKVQMAFVIAVCVTILNPKCERIKLEKKEMKVRVSFYLVSFCKFVNYDLNCQIVKSLFTKISFPLKKKLESNEAIGPDDVDDIDEESEGNDEF